MENNFNINDKDLENAILQGDEVPFFMTPNDIFDLDLDLDIYEKIVYIYICRCSNNGKTAFPSIKTISKKCGMGETKARYSINSLEKKGLLSKVMRKNGNKNNLSNVYILKRDIKNTLSGEKSIEKTSKINLQPTSSGEEGAINLIPQGNITTSSCEVHTSCSEVGGASCGEVSTSCGEAKKELLKNNYNKNNNRKEKEDLALSDSIPKDLEGFFNTIKATNKISDLQFKTWISNLDINIKDNSLEIITSSNFIKGVIESKYLGLLKHCSKIYFNIEDIVLKSAS